MNPEGSARTTRISRRQMLCALSIGGAGTAFDWHAPAYAAQAASAAGDAPVRGAEPLSAHGPGVLRRARERAAPAAAGTARRAEDEGRRGGVRADGPREDPRVASGRSPRRRRSTRASREVVERDAYKIEKVIFESRPGFLVYGQSLHAQGTAVPAAGRRRLVRPLGERQGERHVSVVLPGPGAAGLRRPDLRPDRPGRAHAVRAMSNWKPTRGTRRRRAQLRGQPAVPGGEFFGTWRAWDGIRALDYLLSRARRSIRTPRRHHRQLRRRHDDDVAVRPGRSRWTMAAPSCFVTELRRNMENELAADTEQMPAARARARSRSRGLSRGARAEAGHHPGEGEGLLRRARERSRVRAAEAALPPARRGGQRRLLHRADLPRLLAGEPRGDVPMVQSRAPASPTPRRSRNW